MRWYTSDHHFWHKNIIQYCQRPFPDVDAMTEGLIEKWNGCIQPTDEVYVIGDFSFERGLWLNQELLKRLKGRKVLILGNHDPSVEKCKTWGFDEVHGRITHQIAGETVLLCHYPYAAPPKGVSNPFEYDQRFTERRPIDRGGWLIHGHVHGAWKVLRKQINVGVDVWEYSPVSEETIAGIIQG